MKYFSTVLIVALSIISVQAQRSVDEQINLGTTKQVVLEHKFANVTIQTWNKEYVGITGNILINQGENDDAFTIDSQMKGDKTHIRTFIKDMDKLPEYIKVTKGEEVTIKRREKGEKWKGISKQIDKDCKGCSVTVGVLKEIELVVHVPINKAVEVYAKFGEVNVAGVGKELKVKTKFAAVEVECDALKGRSFDIDYEWGSVFTDLNLTFLKERGPFTHKENRILADYKGGGKLVKIESEFGDVYIRKKK